MDKLNVAVGETLGFYTASLFAPLKDAARRVHRDITRALGKTDLFRMLVADVVHPTLLDTLYFQKMGLLDSGPAKMFLKKMRWHTLSFGTALTNIGRVDMPCTFGPLTLDAVFGPALYSDVDEKTVGAVTAGGKLTFVLSCNESAVGAGTAEALKASVLKIIDAAI